MCLVGLDLEVLWIWGIIVFQRFKFELEEYTEYSIKYYISSKFQVSTDSKNEERNKSLQETNMETCLRNVFRFYLKLSDTTSNSAGQVGWNSVPRSFWI